MPVSSVFANHRGVVALASGTLLVASMAASAQAATPASGSLSETSAPVQWTAGPFAAANAVGPLVTSCALLSCAMTSHFT